MELKIEKDAIEAAIQEHLDKAVSDGLSYKIKGALDEALADAVTPELVQGYVEAAMGALTDAAVTERIVTEINAAMAEAVRMTMQEAVVTVVAKLRGYRPDMKHGDSDRVDEIRRRLFPGMESPNE